MNNVYKLIIFLSLLISGCKSNLTKEASILQKIDNLVLDIYTSEGTKIYSINSPYSSYNKENQTFNLNETNINIFKNDKPQYIINSDLSKLTNNNKILELKGNVKLKTVLQNEDVLYADKFIWNIDDSIYLLTGNVKFENNNVILSSKKAILNSNNIIEFFNPVKYIIKNDKNKNNYEINSENAFYNIDTKSVSFKSKSKRVRSKIYF